MGAKEEIIWSWLPHPGCRRRKCFWEKVEKVHEYTEVDGGPITLRRTFKCCGQRQYGCPKSRRLDE